MCCEQALTRLFVFQVATKETVDENSGGVCSADEAVEQD
jgi:hypothetical protein